MDGKAAAAASAGQNEDTQEMVDYDKLEPPAENWIDLVEAFRTKDPAKVNTVLARAKQSLWTQKLWAEEISQAVEWNDGESEESYED